MPEDFADSSGYNTFSKPEYRKNEYIHLPQGTSVIRILQPKAKKQVVHYLGRGYVKCLGEACPICENNRKLIRDYPETFRREKMYSAAISRYYVNVLDRTPAKVCGSCGKEYKNLDVNTCGECNGILPTEASPLNRVRILAKGTSLFVEQFNVIQKAIKTPEGEPLGITNYDINLFVKGEGRNTQTTAIADPTRNDVVEVNEEELFDVNSLTVELEPAEMLEVQRGVSFKDIFAARRSASKEQDAERTEDAKDSIDSLFSE